MSRFPLCLSASLLALTLVLAAPRTSEGQSLWSTPYKPNQIAIEVLQPSLDAVPEEDISVLTGAASLWGSFLLTDRTTLTAGLPMARYASDIDGDTPVSITKSQIGNPYVGVGVSSTRVPLLVEWGVRLPLASDSSAATWAGTGADLVHREAFAPDLFSTQLVLNSRWELTRVAGVRFRGGPLLTVPTADNDGTAEFLLRYGAQAWYEGDRYILGAGVTGRALVTEQGIALSDRTTHQVSGTVILNLPLVQPGLLLRAPLNGPGSDDVSLVVGLTLSITPE